MIQGIVNSENQAVIRLAIYGKDEREDTVEAVIDTGFNAWLTLPSQRTAYLQLKYSSRGRAELADGSECVFDVYEAHVQWDGVTRRILAYQAESEPLVGMAMLSGYQLKIDVEHEGAVTIQRLVERSS